MWLTRLWQPSWSWIQTGTTVCTWRTTRASRSRWVCRHWRRCQKPHRHAPPPAQGPHSITFDSEGTMYFTDPGPLGESTLANPAGSLFTIRSDGLLRPLALECLAHPTGIAVSPGDKAVYVAETMANRILRLVADPSGVFHTSVFASFSGRLGPVALACDHERGGVLYVGHFDFEGCSSGGLVSVLSPEGKLLMELFVASPEVSGLAISHDGQSLVVTDSAQNTLQELSLSEVHV